MAADSAPAAAILAASIVPKISWRCCQASSNPAAATAGSESKKDSRAAVRRSKPLSMPDAIVMPLREMPGMRASTCDNPIVRPSEKCTLWRPSRSVCPRLLRHHAAPSASVIRSVPNSTAAATTSSWRACPRIKWRAAKPTTTIGSVPRAIMIATREAAVASGWPVLTPVKNPSSKCRMSCRMATQTASRVPH